MITSSDRMAIITVLVVAVAMLLVMITTVVVVPVDLVVGGCAL